MPAELTTDDRALLDALAHALADADAAWVTSTTVAEYRWGGPGYPHAHASYARVVRPQAKSGIVGGVARALRRLPDFVTEHETGRWGLTDAARQLLA